MRIYKRVIKPDYDIVDLFKRRDFFLVDRKAITVDTTIARNEFDRVAMMLRSHHYCWPSLMEQVSSD